MYNLIPLVAIIILACSLVLPGDAKAEGRPLVFGGASFPPYFGADMKNGGPLIDIVRSAFAVSDRQISIRWMPWRRVVSMSQHGDIDGITFAWLTAERKEFLIFGDAVFPNNNGLFKYFDNPLSDLETMSQLKGKTIGIVGGYAVPEYLLNSGARFVHGAEDLNLLKMLAHKRLDYVYTDKQVGLYLLKFEPPAIQNKVVWLKTLEVLPSYLAISRNIRNADPAVILDQWSKGLKTIKASGKYNAILQQYNLTTE